MTTWIDATVRLTAPPEVDYQPGTDEFEFSFPIPEVENGRVTLLVPRDAVVKATEKVQDMLALIPLLR